MLEKIPLVLGLGLTGQSVINYLSKSHNEIFIVEDSKENPYLNTLIEKGENFHINPDLDDELFQFISEIYASPGVSREHEIFAYAKKHKIKVTSDIEKFVEINKCLKVLVTGTNGKTSTCLYIESLFRNFFPELKVSVLGNIGKPVLSSIEEEIDIAIIEVSSFQLELLNQIHFDIGLLLNIEQDHMDIHSSFEEYKKIKYSILEKALFNISYDSSKAFLKNSFCYKDLKLPKELIESKTFNNWPLHDLDNLTASLAVLKCYSENFCNLPLDEINLFKEIEKIFHKFVKLPHRFELVKTSTGLNFINDSKATNLDAMLKAIEASRKLNQDGDIYLICGGDMKCQEISLIDISNVSEVKRILIYGKDRKILYESMESHTDCQYVKDIQEALENTLKLASENDYVLFSPGCSSLDMFSNYEERGDEFKRLIADLTNE